MNILKSNEDAEECVNDTFLRTWNVIPPNKPSFLRSWLGKITRNLSLDCYKKRHTLKRGGNEIELLFSELEGCIPSSENTIKTLEDAEIGKLISHFLRGLPKEKRIIFLRRYFYGDAIKQIAARFDISESKVKSSLSRTRNALRLFLEKEGVCI